MKKKMILVLKGIIIGAGKIIPGVSGGMLAITLNVYDKGIYAISNFFKDVRKNFTFLFTISIGILISVLFISKIIKYMLNNHYLPTMLLFIGLIVGGISPLIAEAKKEKSLKNIIIMTIPLVLLFTLSILSNNWQASLKETSSFLTFILMGVIDSITMIIPGISGTAILMMLGYYDLILESISSLNNLALLSSNLTILIPFTLGILMGVIALSKIINYLLNRHKCSCYYAIIGFTIASIFFLLVETLKDNYTFIEVCISFILFIIGYFISARFDKIDSYCN